MENKNEREISNMLMKQARSLVEAEMFSQAEDLLQSASKIVPNNPEIHSMLASLLGQRGEINGALIECDIAILVSPNYVPAYNMRAVLLENKDDLTQAEQILLKAKEIDSTIAMTHYNLGCILSKRDKKEEAAEAYRNALRIQPNHVEARGNLALILAHQGFLEQADREFRIALQYSPKAVINRFNLALNLIDQNSLKTVREAISILEELVKESSLDVEHEVLNHARQQQSQILQEQAAKFKRSRRKVSLRILRIMRLISHAANESDRKRCILIALLNTMGFPFLNVQQVMELLSYGANHQTLFAHNNSTSVTLSFPMQSTTTITSSNRYHTWHLSRSKYGEYVNNLSENSVISKKHFRSSSTQEFPNKTITNQTRQKLDEFLRTLFQNKTPQNKNYDPNNNNNNNNNENHKNGNNNNNNIPNFATEINLSTVQGAIANDWNAAQSTTRENSINDNRKFTANIPDTENNDVEVSELVD